MNLRLRIKSSQYWNWNWLTSVLYASWMTSKRQELLINRSYSGRFNKCKKSLPHMKQKKTIFKKSYNFIQNKRMTSIKNSALKICLFPSLRHPLTMYSSNYALNKSQEWNCKLRETIWWPRPKYLKIEKRITAKWPISCNRHRPKLSCWNKKLNNGMKIFVHLKCRDRIAHSCTKITKPLRWTSNYPSSKWPKSKW